MIQTQTHSQVAIKDLDNVFFVILATQTEQHSRVILINHEFLKFSVRGIYFHAIKTILSANAFPKRLVAVKDNHFVWFTPDRENPSRNHRCQGGKEFRRERNMAYFV
jgi:hypothetical protein